MSDDDILSSKPVLPPPKSAPADKGDVVSQRAPADRQVLENAPDETLLSGTAKNLATTVGKGLSHVPGLPGDIVQMGLGVGASALAKMPWEDRNRHQIEQQWRKDISDSSARQRADLEAQAQKPGLSDAERARIRSHISRIHDLPPTGEEVYQTLIAPRVGEYTPTTMPGRFGRAAGEAAIPAMLTPGLGLARGATSGAAAGVAGEAASHYAGVEDPLALLAIGAVGAGVPSVANKYAVQPVKRAMRTPTLGEKEIEAGKGIVKYTEDPDKALAAAKARAHLPDEPLAEATLDASHAAAQDTILSTGQPDLTRTLQQRRTAQNLAVLEKLRGLGPIAAEPTDVSKGFQQHLDALNVARDEQAAAVPRGLPANEAGAALREHVQKAADTFSEALDKLKAGVPNLPVWTQDLGKWVRDQQTSLEKREMKTRSPLADQIYDMAAKMGDVTNLHDLVDLDQSVSAMMRKANSPMNVDGIGHAQLVQLKGQIKHTLDAALENEHKLQQEAVARGELAPDATFAHGLQNAVDAWRAERQQAVAGGDRQGQAATGSPGGPSSVPGVGGAERPAAGGSPDAAGTTGIPGDAGAAAERLKLFNKGWGMYRDIYGKGEVGNALESPGIGGQYKVADSEVANKAFASGSKGFDNAQMWLKAGGEEGLVRLKDVAYGRLQSDLKGKPLDPKTLDAWKSKHADALRAIDDADTAAGRPKFSDQFNDAATAQKAVHSFENGAASDFLGLKHPDDIVRQVRDLMGGRDSAQSITTLVDQAKALPNGEAILGGLRRAGAQALENEFRNEGAKLPTDRGFEPMIGGARLQKYIHERRNTLDALFEPEAVEQMAKVAEQVDRSTAVRTMMTTQHGSHTALRTGRMRELRMQMDAAMAQDIRNGTQTTFSALAMWEGLKGLTEAVRGHGMEGTLMAGAMLGISRAWQSALQRAGVRQATTQADIAHLMAQGFASRDTGVALMQKALNEHGIPNQRAFDQLARSLVGAEAAAQSEQERPERASGGRVEDLAAHMIKAVERARKMDTERTKPLLNHDDSIVARALEIAGRTIG